MLGKNKKQCSKRVYGSNLNVTQIQHSTEKRLEVTHTVITGTYSQQDYE